MLDCEIRVNMFDLDCKRNCCVTCNNFERVHCFRSLNGVDGIYKSSFGGKNCNSLGNEE